MRSTTRLLLLLTAAAPVIACFDFGKYSFSEQEPGAAVMSQAPAAGSGGGVMVSPLPGAGGRGDVPCQGEGCAPGELPLAGQLGASCQSGAECASGYCVDGVCCEGACSAACEACNVPGNLGYCQGIQVDDECLTSQGCPASSDCLRYESGSAGACAGRGSCSASQSCMPVYLPLGTPCSDGTGQCNGSGACVGSKLPLGAACASASDCQEGFCAPTDGGARVCCNQACDGVCEQCSALGLCNEAPAVDPVHCTPPLCPADDICRDYPPSPSAASCSSFGKCLGEEACAPDARRPASDCVCGASGCKLAQGKACTSAADCATGFCNNGVCCNSACDGTCQQCNQATGVCGQIAGCECAPGETTTCGARFGRMGDCAARQITCSGAGQWPVQQCNAQGAELCNNDGRDEDCDGNPRNGCTCLNGQLSDCTEQRRAQGVCARRTLTCTNGQWPVAQCNATSQEVCRNGLDDDCDGAVDENPPCAPVFNGRNCDFSRCEDLRCTQCGGCDACAQIVLCVRDDNPGCASDADPLCRNNGCRAQVEEGELQLFGENGDIPATDFAEAYVRCACTR